jgi:Ser/Thr protein kinase RdoA (MazF antagonist)
MTKDAGYKKAVRRHAQETGQRYTDALTDLEGHGLRIDHEPNAERLLAHLRDRYRIDAVAATKLSIHKSYLFRIDRKAAAPWIARAFPPARPRAGAEGDAAILRFLERKGFPAERLAVDDAVSDFEGGSVLVTRFVESKPFTDPTDKLGMMADLLGRLHALPLDDSIDRPGGAEGVDPRYEGSPRQDLMEALSFLDAVDSKVPPAERERFEQLRDRVRSSDAGEGLPEALVHGNLLHSPDHALLTDRGVEGINWTAAGRGPRVSDFAWLMWGTWLKPEAIAAAVDGYRRHVELSDEELDRFEGVMSCRPLRLSCFSYWRDLMNGRAPSEEVWGFINPKYLKATAAATRTAFGR